MQETLGACMAKRASAQQGIALCPGDLYVGTQVGHTLALPVLPCRFRRNGAELDE